MADSIPISGLVQGRKADIGLVVPEGGGVRTVADLKGRNVGLASPDQDRAYLTAALKKAGLGIDDVETTTVGPGSASVARTLESGRVAAYAGTLTDFSAFDDAGLPVRDIHPLRPRRTPGRRLRCEGGHT